MGKKGFGVNRVNVRFTCSQSGTSKIPETPFQSIHMYNQRIYEPKNLIPNKQAVIVGQHSCLGSCYIRLDFALKFWAKFKVVNNSFSFLLSMWLSTLHECTIVSRPSFSTFVFILHLCRRVGVWKGNPWKYESEYVVCSQFRLVWPRPLGKQWEISVNDKRSSICNRRISLLHKGTGVVVLWVPMMF